MNMITIIYATIISSIQSRISIGPEMANKTSAVGFRSGYLLSNFSRTAEKIVAVNLGPR